MDDPDQWTPRDLALGLLFLVVGVLALVFSILAMRDGLPLTLWGLGWVVGPVFLLIGGNGVQKATRAALRKRGEAREPDRNHR